MQWGPCQGNPSVPAVNKHMMCNIYNGRTHSMLVSYLSYRPRYICAGGILLTYKTKHFFGKIETKITNWAQERTCSLYENK